MLRVTGAATLIRGRIPAAAPASPAPVPFRKVRRAMPGAVCRRLVDRVRCRTAGSFRLVRVVEHPVRAPAADGVLDRGAGRIADCRTSLAALSTAPLPRGVTPEWR